MHRKSTTPPAPSFTSDFPGSPYRVAYDRESREYVVVEVETGAELDWFGGGASGYQDAYRAAARHNTDAAELALEASAALLDEQAYRAAEAELDRVDAELSARCACYATGSEQPACLAAGRPACERPAPRGNVDLPHIAATAHISLTRRIELRRGFHGYLAVQVDEDAQGYASGYLRTFGDEDEGRQWVSDEAVRQARAARALAS